MMKVILILIVCLLSGMIVEGKKGVVNVSVADLRGKPVAMNTPVGFWHDNEELTQLLWMEPVEILEQDGSWLKVEAPRQAMVYNGTWAPYEGWIEEAQVEVVSSWNEPDSVVTGAQWASVWRKSCQTTGCLPKDLLVHISFGTMLVSVGQVELEWRKVLTPNGDVGYIQNAVVSEISQKRTDPSFTRPKVTKHTDQLLGYLYFWGGRSAFNPTLYSYGQQLTGLDCSGLVGLSYQSLGLLIPRDASKQALAAQEVSSASLLQPGDLFFYGNPTSGHVFHVMMLYAVEDTPRLVESSTNSTRIRTIESAFGVPLSELTYGMTLPSNGNVLTWGTFFPWDPSLWQYGHQIN